MGPPQQVLSDRLLWTPEVKLYQLLQTVCEEETEDTGSRPVLRVYTNTRCMMSCAMLIPRRLYDYRIIYSSTFANVLYEWGT